ncbi:AAA family ATPase [Ralstonia mannitolilytica]|uniref:AAA family ATPase n=1 Tax=Ralstonia mannitolilytica TaxID=105219 RepID=UPI00292E9402|nr:AAA family ATPase [Ralstonia mannitolilytica]
MWPRKLPEWVIQDPRRAAECNVYKKLDLVLDDEWSVYYSRPWWGLSRTGGEIDGEADFVVAHPDWGVLFLEVKGGLVRHDPLTSKWTSRDRLGIKHTIKDPMQQAVRSKHELLKKFRLAAGWPSRRVRLRHGVIFPDSQPDGEELVGGYEQELFCFSEDLRDRLRSWVVQRLASHAEDRLDREVGPGRNGIAAIDSTIAAPTRLRVPLHRQLDGDVTHQDAIMTGAQLQAIAFIDCHPRVVVEGGAGTGKTVIACELAVRYAEAGRSVILCCLSAALAASLEYRIGKRPNLDVMTVNELRAAKLAGKLGRYEAVVVDEGQDVDWSDWDLVEGCLSPRSLLRVLFDSNQAVYRARDDLESRLQAKSIPLLLNLRNTKRIASVTEPLYQGPLIQCAGPEGCLPLLIETTASQTLDSAIATIQELVLGQSLAPADVAVLVADASIGADIRARLLVSKLRTTDALTRAPNSIVVETIACFKGLESLAVVVLADRLSANNPELSYVAVSRARALLMVIGPVAGTLLGKALQAGGSRLLGGHTEISSEAS